MNLLRNVKKVSAALFCVAGLLTSSFALAGGGSGGGGDDPEFKFVKCDLDDGKLKIWGKVKNAEEGEDLEVRVKIKGVAYAKCKNPGGVIVEAHSGKVWFEIKDADTVDEDGEFKVKTEVARELKDACPNENWDVIIKKATIKDISVKLYDGNQLLDTARCDVEACDGDCQCDT
jgi:hypothetical protein